MGAGQAVQDGEEELGVAGGVVGEADAQGVQQHLVETRREEGLGQLAQVVLEDAGDDVDVRDVVRAQVDGARVALEGVAQHALLGGRAAEPIQAWGISGWRARGPGTRAARQMWERGPTTAKNAMVFGQAVCNWRFFK